MAFLEFDKKVTVTSTGYTERFVGYNVREWQVVAETAAGSTCTFQLQTARDASTTAVPIPYGTSQNLDASSGVSLQFSGPAVIFARVSAITSTGTLYLRFTGN